MNGTLIIAAHMLQVLFSDSALLITVMFPINSLPIDNYARYSVYIGKLNSQLALTCYYVFHSNPGTLKQATIYQRYCDPLTDDQPRVC